MSDVYPAVDEALARLGAAAHVCMLIADRHSEPHRHYHTLRHVDLMLGELPADHAHGREMIAATLFHDIVYEPARSDNEEQSLEAFKAAAGSLSPNTPLDVPLVSAMILATKSHHFRSESTRAADAINILLKADLSILWHPDPAVYAWYAGGVRREYAFVPDAAFAQARGRILMSLRSDILGSGKLRAREAETLVRNLDWELGAG